MTPQNDLINRPAIQALTRRELLSSAVGAALLVACSKNDEAAQESATRTINDHFGPVTVPRRAERVIAASPGVLEYMLALGVRPVASYFNRLVTSAYLGREAEQISNITDSTGDDIDIEKALTYKPDLLIALTGNDGTVPNHHQERYDRYRKAITTFAWNRKLTPLEGFKGNVTTIARTLGVEDRATNVNSDLDARYAAVRARASKVSSKANTIRVYLDHVEVETRRAGGTVSLQELGLAGIKPSSPDEPNINLSLEQLRRLNETDTLLVRVNTDAADFYKTVQANPVWQLLEAVKNGRVHEVNSGVWIGTDPIALNLILDDIERLVIAPAERR